MKKIDKIINGYKHSPVGLIPSDWEVMELGEIFKLTSGKTKPIILVENPIDKNVYPVYGGNGIMGYSSEYNSQGEKIIIGRVGEYCDVTRFINEFCWITDNAISKNNQLITKKEQQKKWLMQQLLNEKIIVKNEKWCKSGVKKVFLKDIAKVTMGQSPNSEDYNTEEDGLPLIQGNADLTDRKQVVRYWTRQSNKKCDAADIIMTVRAPVGAIGIAIYESSIGRGVCSIKPKNVDYWYLYHLLVYKEEQWKKLEQGSTFTAVGSKDIFHFPLFIIHSLEEQTAIAQVLQAADKEIQMLKDKTIKLREKKKGLMQQLLTGKKRLKVKE